MMGKYAEHGVWCGVSTRQGQLPGLSSGHGRHHRPVTALLSTSCHQQRDQTHPSSRAVGAKAREHVFVKSSVLHQNTAPFSVHTASASTTGPEEALPTTPALCRLPGPFVPLGVSGGAVTSKIMTALASTIHKKEIL